MGCQKCFVILEQAFFAQRRIRASRASPRSLPRASASDRRGAFGSLPYQLTADSFSPPKAKAAISNRGLWQTCLNLVDHG